jgi:hypothetical protein
MIMAAAAMPAAAQPENVTDGWSVEFDAGFPSQYDDSDMWHQGYDVGVAGFWMPAASAWSFGARFGITHWSYDQAVIVAYLMEDVVPPGGEFMGDQSTGQLEILTLTPLARYQREHVLPFELGAFVQAGAVITYVKTFALTELKYSSGPVGTDVAVFEVNRNDWYAGVLLAAGLSRHISSSSWVDLLPSYRVVFGDETGHVFAISLGFRARV